MIPPLSRRALLTAASRSVVPASAAALASLPQPAQAADTKLSALPLGTLPDYIYGIKGGAPNRFRPPYPIYNVKNFGAFGDSVLGNLTSGHDDTVAIQNAINAAGNVGATVYFPPGTYKVTKTLIVGGLVGFLGEYAHGPNYGVGTVVWGRIPRAGNDVTTGYLLVCVQQGTASYPPGSGSITYPVGVLGGMKNIWWDNQYGGCVFCNNTYYSAIDQCEFSGIWGLIMVGPPLRGLGPAPVSGFCHVRNCMFKGGPSTPASIGCWIQTGCLYSCDAIGMNYGFVLTGAVPNMIACRSETTDVALLVGQDPIYGTGAIQATGGTILGFQTEQCRTYYYFYSAADMLMAGSAIGETLAPPSYPTSSGYGLNILRCNFVHNCIFMNNAFNCASNLGIQNACVQFDAIPDGVVMIGNPCTPGVGPGTTYIMPPLVANTEYGDPLTIIPNGTTFPETATVHYKKRTFSQLPKNINFGMKIGDEYYLTDLTSNAYGAVAAGGGTQSGWVKFNGTNWKVFSP